LSGVVPRIAVVSGRCFAGNAVIAGCSDLIVATENVSLGMGGPAMIEGGGLGRVDPDEIGPLDMQTANGVIDVALADEAEATAVTKRLLAYFQGPTPAGPEPDQSSLRGLVPERQRRAYPVNPIVETLCDEGSVIFLRERFAPEMVTALARIEGRPIGSSPTTRCTWRERSLATPRTRPRGSCSCATRSASRSCRSSTRRA